MLKSIYISNFAIIEQLELDFFTGMSVLTGETGAGKSIIIDALNLALGDRADRSAARNAGKKVEIVATIEISNLNEVTAWLQERDLQAGDDCVLRRVVSPDSKSKAYINNTPCSLTVLRNLGDLLVDVYGQHEHQSLMRKDKQRILLDNYASNDTKTEKLATVYRLWQSLNNQLQKILNNHENTLSQLELLRYQNAELEQLGLGNNEYEKINEQYLRLNSAKELIEGCNRMSQQLAGDNENTTYDHLSSTVSELEKLSRSDSMLEEPLEELQSIHIRIKDIANTLRDYSERISTNPQELQQLEERISAVEEIARKHKVKPTELVSLHSSIQAELNSLENEHENPNKIKNAMQEAELHYQMLAKQISSSRKLAAKKLNKKITDLMQSLGMQGGQFQINIQPKKTQELSLNGLDDIQFMVSMNPGQSLLPIQKVASGGELSRLSLAIQMATANNLGIPTLIFDEVDAGVGGATAEVVGRHLRKLGNDAQVLCVTHLAQVAAQAHHHYKVNKFEQDDSVSTEISHLTENARIDELARMLGGIEMTQNTHEYAKEMLSQTKNN